MGAIHVTTGNSMWVIGTNLSDQTRSDSAMARHDLENDG